MKKKKKKTDVKIIHLNKTETVFEDCTITVHNFAIQLGESATVLSFYEFFWSYGI